MKYFLLLILFSVELTGCRAVGESDVEQKDIEDLDTELQEFIETEEITNVMHIFADDGDNDYIVFNAPGATQVDVEEAEEHFLEVRIEEPDDGEADILHVYELRIGMDIEMIRYYINGEQTHVDALAK